MHRLDLLNLSINKIKVHYFFSKSDDINRFLKETEIHLVIEGNEEVIAHG